MSATTVVYELLALHSRFRKVSEIGRETVFLFCYKPSPHRWVVVDMEYYALSQEYGKGVVDTIAYIDRTWKHRQNRVGMTI